MRKSHLGEFEEVVLLTVGILHGNAYGVSIREEIEKRLNRSVSIGSLQVTLRRMERKGYLTSAHGETNPLRGGRPKLYFEITPYGKQLLECSRETRNSLWDALPQLILNLK
ncbi:MAG: helix-turn-helix transcriptional regulator [Bacteroidota bacterium]